MAKKIRSSSVVDHVADELRRAIYDRRYRPGQRLVERQVAADLGVSHIPVREALARLVEERLVEHEPRRGCRVAELSATELEELSSIRILLEQFVVVRVQERLTPKAETELRRIVATMEAAAKRGDVQEVVRADEQFHTRLWSLADHGVLTELTAGLRRRISAFLGTATISLAGDELVQHAHSHAVLLDAIVDGDARRVRRAMATHIEKAAARIRRSIEVGDD